MRFARERKEVVDVPSASRAPQAMCLVQVGDSRPLWTRPANPSGSGLDAEPAIRLRGRAASNWHFMTSRTPVKFKHFNLTESSDQPALAIADAAQPSRERDHHHGGE